jgi:hypothetical protein
MAGFEKIVYNEDLKSCRYIKKFHNNGDKKMSTLPLFLATVLTIFLSFEISADL